jgi:adenosylhomocysteine nucleosidase
VSGAGLRIVCALPAEAKPLIARYRLQAHGLASPFRVYRGPEGARWLVISGVGKIAAAAAVAHLAAVSAAAPHHLWLNLGLCGHSASDPGTLFRASKLIDMGSARRFYPQLLTPVSCAQGTLRTVEQPSADYPEEGMYDMEASGFFASAIRYTSQELIQVFKVVSDSPKAPLRRFDKREVSAWIEGCLDGVEEALEGLLVLSSEESERLADPEGYASFLERWHFSESQRLQLRRLLARWAALDGGLLDPDEAQQIVTSRALLQWLTKRVETLPVGWGGP